MSELDSDGRPATKTQNGDISPTQGLHARFLLDWSWILFLVYGGCCTNSWSLQHLLSASTSIGSALTFFQMSFIALQGLPSFLAFSTSFPFVRIRPRIVPLSKWALQVVVNWLMTLLNNLAFAYNVPLSLLIVFRSGGLAVSMLFGYLRFGRRYSYAQIASILMVSAGVIITTLSRPQKSTLTTQDQGSYAIGVLLLTTSLLLTGYFGTLQEQTYARYGPCWKEGLFYTHFLSIPLFIPISSSVLNGVSLLRLHASSSLSSSFLFLLYIPLNLASQLTCVAGVNMLTARVSSVSTNIVLTSRKAVSLVISVWVMGRGEREWNVGMTVGSLLVGLGSVGYAIVSRTRTRGKKE